MRISYKKLWKMLIDREMKKKDLAELAERITYFYKLTDEQRNTMRIQAVKTAHQYDSDEISRMLISKMKEI